MKKLSFSLLSAASAVALSACSFGSSSPTAPTDTTAPTDASGAQAAETSKTGLDGSGKTVPFGATGTISTQVPNGVIMMKKEYDFPGGKATLEGAIVVDKDGTITSVQIFNPTGYIEKFSKEVGALTIGKKISGLKIDTISGASLTTAAFNEVLAEHAN